MSVNIEIFKQALRGQVPSQLFSWLEEDEVEAGLAARFAQELERTYDTEFGQRFFAGCPVAGCTAEDYLQRVIEFDLGQVLTSIRFLGGDVNWPFVEVIASTNPIDGESRWDAFFELMQSSYAKFKPRAVRVFAQAEFGVLKAPRVSSELRTSVDQLILVGSLEGLARRLGPLKSGRVRLEITKDAKRAADLVSLAYQEFNDECPELGEAIFAADSDDLEQCARTGLLTTILVDDEPAGVLASRHDLASHFYGQCVVEQVLTARYRGRGFAVAAQQRFINELAERHPKSVIWGTIDSRNGASIATAKRSGREVLGGWYWVSHFRQ